jgi:outer membrane protein OmpA-like peptidoglycan-associated protein
LVIHHEEEPVADSPKIAFMINFEYNSARVLDDSLPYLDTLGKMLSQKNLQDKDLIIEGHADAKGGYTYNLSLSEQRAQAVKRYLVSVHHIDAKRLLCVGKGNTELLNPDKPFAPENRRVQFLAWHHE